MAQVEPQPVRIAAGTGEMPRHVAIIMDGNGRWAKKRMLPRAMGHKRGVETVRNIVRAAGELGLETLSLYAFSSENWKRPAEEINDLMALMRDFIKSDLDTFAAEGGPSATLHSAIYQRSLSAEQYRQSVPFFVESVATQPSAGDLLAAITNGAGARTNEPGTLDPVDALIVSWNDSRALTAPPLNALEKQDGDGDGLPDAWEAAHGLNLHDAKDANLDPDGDGYNNLEDYLNSYYTP